MPADRITVEVVYATAQQQTVLTLELAAGSSAKQAIDASGILQQFPDIDLKTQKIGIFGMVAKSDSPLMDGDRVEIYRPLQQNPMAARRKRL